MYGYSLKFIIIANCKKCLSGHGEPLAVAPMFSGGNWNVSCTGGEK